MTLMMTIAMLPQLSIFPSFRNFFFAKSIRDRIYLNWMNVMIHWLRCCDTDLALMPRRNSLWIVINEPTNKGWLNGCRWMLEQQRLWCSIVAATLWLICPFFNCIFDFIFFLIWKESSKMQLISNLLPFCGFVVCQMKMHIYSINDASANNAWNLIHAMIHGKGKQMNIE